VYSILISLLIGAAVAVGYTLLALWKTWAMGLILGTLVALGSFVLISRVLAKRFEPRFMQVQKQIQAGANQAALKGLEEMLALSRWQILLAGQIHAQMGLLSYAMDRDDQAIEHLSRSGLRVPDAQVALAALHYRRKEKDKAKDVLEVAIKANKKQILLYNVLAWMLYKQGEREAAIRELQRALKVESGSEATQDNLLRAQNNKKLNMKRFGTSWYALKLEKPPAALRQGHPAGMRRGFRNRKQRGR
jgi:tetratricopeptide (TPR) repeat protein